jgi:head-tail adaptor
MRGSQLDRRITILAAVLVQEQTFGSIEETWATYAGADRIAAQVQDLLPAKAETAEGGLRLARRTSRVRIRYRAGVTAAMRIVLHGSTDETLQIVGQPAELGRREWLEFVVERASS